MSETSASVTGTGHPGELRGTHWLLLGLCLALFVALRLVWVGHLLAWDEAMTLCTVRSFVSGGEDYFSNWLWRHPPLFPLLMSLFNPLKAGFAERVEVLAIVLGAVNLLLLFVLNRRWFGIPVALASVFFLAVMPGAVFFDVWVKTDHPVTTFGLLAIMLLASNRTFYAGLSLGLAFLFKETAVFYAGVVGLLWLCGVTGRRRFSDLLAITLVPAATCGWWYLMVTLQPHGNTPPGSTPPGILDHISIASGANPLWVKPWHYYAGQLLTDLGLLGAALSLGGLAVLAWRACSGFSAAVGHEPEEAEQEKRSSAFVGSFVDKAPDKASQDSGASGQLEVRWNEAHETHPALSPSPSLRRTSRAPLPGGEAEGEDPLQGGVRACPPEAWRRRGAGGGSVSQRSPDHPAADAPVPALARMRLWPALMAVPSILLLCLLPGKVPWIVIVLLPALATLQAVGLAALVTGIHRRLRSLQGATPRASRVTAAGVAVVIGLIALLAVCGRDYESVFRRVDPGQCYGASCSREAARALNRLVRDDERVLLTSFHYWQGIQPGDPCAVFAYYYERRGGVLLRSHKASFEDLVSDIRKYKLNWAMLSPELGQAEYSLFDGFIKTLKLKPCRLTRAYIFHTASLHEPSP